MLISRLTSNSVNFVKFFNTNNVYRAMCSATNKNVIFEEKKNKGIITLNRPKALNAINLDMVREMYQEMTKWENKLDLVIMKGAGEKSFCAGGDVRAVVEAGLCEASKNFFRHEYTLNALIGTYKIPYIAIIDGITMGGGVGLSVHGKYRIATERTLFAMPETAIGLFPDVGGSYFLTRLDGQLGLYLGLTGIRLKGLDVVKSGVATHFCKSDKLDDLEESLLECKNESDVEKTLNKHCPEDKSHDFSLAKYLDKINHCFNSRTIEGIIINLEKDNSEWAQTQIKLLKKLSPTSLKVTHRQLEYGSKMQLLDCLKMEFRMAVHHLENSDFKEGVRALLIEKDQHPKWDPKTIEEVDEDIIQFYFRPLQEHDELKLDDKITENYNQMQSKL